jgi:NAD(P)-dependent dehydrogenase (short-subunit alcohol dehydrogenase family)
MTTQSSRIVVVTGAAGALGSVIVRHLAAGAAGLVLLDLSRERLMRQTSELLTTHDVEVFAIDCDLANENSISQAAVAVKKRFGRCDVLVNNVGFLPKAASLERISTETWDRAFAVNLRSAFLCSREFGSMMLDQRSGCIVSIGSAAASLPNSSASYAVSKAALVALSRQIAVEWGPRGVRSNIVSPGFLRTPLSEHFYAADSARQARELTVPVRRIGTPEDVARVVSFLTSDAASYVNGQEVIVDGGQSQTSLMLLQPEREAYANARAWP